MFSYCYKKKIEKSCLEEKELQIIKKINMFFLIKNIGVSKVEKSNNNYNNNNTSFNYISIG